MSKVVIYIKPRCWYCKAALKLLNGKGVSYELVDLTAAPERRAEMLERATSHTVPQIFVGDIALGGYTDLRRLDDNGELDGLLAGALASTECG